MTIFRKFSKQKSYHLMLVPALALTVLFCYLPMFGIIIAFKDYSFRLGIVRSHWVGLKNFSYLFTDMQLLPSVLNTVAISILNLLLAFPAAILFAILLNEIGSVLFKRFVQTVSYLPHFISWIVVSVIMLTFLSPTEGIINDVLVKAGIVSQPVLFLGEEKYFWWVAVLSNIWKETGWSAIIYIAAIASIDTNIYEASMIDGAGRLCRIWYITLPSIKSSIAIMFIFAVSAIPFIGFEQSLLLGNPMNYNRSIVLSHYVYKTGLQMGDYSYSTAVGLVMSTVSASLMLLANTYSKKTSGIGVV